MFCENCGEQINDNATVCPNCGVHISNEKPISIENGNNNTVSPNKANNSRKTIIVSAVIAAVIFLIVIIAVIANRTNPQHSYYNDANNIYEENEEAINEKTEDYLVDLDYVSKDDEISIESSETGYANNGEEYTKYLFSTSPYQMISYNIYGKYDKLTALWSICEQNKDTEDNNAFEIYVDNEKVYESKSITAGDLPEKIEVNLNYGSLLTILFTEGYGAAELGNVTLSSSSNSYNEADIVEPPEWLTNIEYLNKDNNVNVENSVHLTNTDESYSHIIYGWANEERCSITYYLNGEYTKLSGLWTILQDNRDTEEKSKFSIYADGNIIYESSIITSGSTPEEFEIDIDNCSKLTITFEKGDGSAELGNLKVW